MTRRVAEPLVAFGRTIQTDGWLESLILNILNTRARTDVRCPSPAGVYGHWSESYREDGLHIGSRLWNAADKSYVRVADAVKAIGAAIRADMAKLTQLGLATQVDVTAEYQGRGQVAVTIRALTQSGPRTLNLSGVYASDTWVWQTSR